MTERETVVLSRDCKALFVPIGIQVNAKKGTEVHLVSRLARAAKASGVQVRILSDCQCLCTTMYRIDEPHLLWTLDHLAHGKVVNKISVHRDARGPALQALERMLELSKAPAMSVD